MALSQSDIAAVIGKVVRETIDKTHDELSARIAALEENTCSFRGAFNRVEAYRKGAVVNSGDCLWVCIRDAEPGGDKPPGPNWQLMFRPVRVVEPRTRKETSND